MRHPRSSSAARRIALGLELGVAATADLVTGAPRAKPATIGEHLADVAEQLFTILGERLEAEPDQARIAQAQARARESCERLRRWAERGVDELGAALGSVDRDAVERFLRDLAGSLAQPFGYTRAERVALRASVLGETEAAAAERVRQQDVELAEGRDPGWRWSLARGDRS